MSPAVPFHPGTATTIARGSPCLGPHERYINWRPSDVSQLGGPSWHNAGPKRRGRRTLGWAHEAMVNAVARTSVKAARHGVGAWPLTLRSAVRCASKAVGANRKTRSAADRE